MSQQADHRIFGNPYLAKGLEATRRARTPADNATIESFFATIKGERLYHGSYSDPIELLSDADAFVIYYNEDRLHGGSNLKRFRG